MNTPPIAHSPGNKWQGMLEQAADFMKTKADAFDSFVQSPDATRTLEAANSVAICAMAILFSRVAPVAVVFGTVVGLALRVFPSEKLGEIQESIQSIWDNTPFYVRALGGAFALVFTPFVFPFAAGMLLGREGANQVPSQYLPAANDKVVI